MILPTKRVTAEQALLAVGAEVLAIIGQRQRTVSQVWTRFQRQRTSQPAAGYVTYDWFVLSLDLLFALGAIEFGRGMLRVSRAH